MNYQRRKDISKIQARVEELSGIIDEIVSDLENIHDEEQEYFDNMPEAIQGGEKGEAAAAAVSALEEALSALEDFYPDTIVSALEEAQS